ncbi:MAG: hypothetical protein WCI38_12060 [Chthoniobacterales bacterium]|jgi:membrane protein implicated in regulation of membrane protease activity
MARFSHRPKRIARRTESEKFARSVMPAAYMIMPVGLALLLAVALGYLVYGSFQLQLLVLGLAVFVLPLLLTLYRVVRGHYSEELDEP